MRGSKNFVRGGQTLTTFFFFFFFFFKLMRDGRIKTPLYAGHHRPASETPLNGDRWRADDGPTLNAGLVASQFFRGSGPKLLRNPIFLRFFRGGGGGVRTPCPTLWIRT